MNQYILCPSIVFTILFVQYSFSEEIENGNEQGGPVGSWFSSLEQKLNVVNNMYHQAETTTVPANMKDEVYPVKKRKLRKIKRKKKMKPKRLGLAKNNKMNKKWGVGKDNKMKKRFGLGKENKVMRSKYLEQYHKKLKEPKSERNFEEDDAHFEKNISAQSRGKPVDIIVHIKMNE